MQYGLGGESASGINASHATVSNLLIVPIQGFERPANRGFL